MTLANDFVFGPATGYHPDFTFSGKRLECDSKVVTGCRSAIPETLESNVPGIYLAGVIVAGSRTSEIFIEIFDAFTESRLRRRLSLKSSRRMNCPTRLPHPIR